MINKEKLHKYILKLADFLKSIGRLGDKLYLYVSKKHMPKYERGALSTKEYIGDNKMFHMVNKNERGIFKHNDK